MKQERRWFVAVMAILLTALAALVARTNLDLVRDDRPLAPDAYVPPDQTPVDESVAEIGPSPSLTPENVVRLQVEALRNNRADDAGIRFAYRFASPANQAQIGPVEAFIQIVRSPEYQLMLNHRRSEFSDMRFHRNRAWQDVWMEAENGVEVIYRYSLSRQVDGPLNGCWMVDGVQPLGMRQPVPPTPEEGEEAAPQPVPMPDGAIRI